ncbi:hypothetical protein PoB_004962200 [Plakobranchus ocellatus]|uniref:Uncharacterized protein n=1 Tax=Plakobranchus ocellatus TaxID=259542 RepID=A0AAV4BVP6_9GAST|nr:hypothetical protein PoB_004962200 [Plakobranchus ocellatus]
MVTQIKLLSNCTTSGQAIITSRHLREVRHRLSASPLTTRTLQELEVKAVVAIQNYVIEMCVWGAVQRRTVLHRTVQHRTAPHHPRARAVCPTHRRARGKYLKSLWDEWLQ